MTHGTAATFEDFSDDRTDELDLGNASESVVVLDSTNIEPQKKSFLRRMLINDFTKNAALGAAVTTSIKLTMSMTGAGAVVTGITVGVGKTAYDVGIRDRKKLIELFNQVAEEKGVWAARRKIALNVAGRLAVNTGGGLLGALGIDHVLNLAKDYIPGAASVFEATRNFCAPAVEWFKNSSIGSKIVGGFSAATAAVSSGWEWTKNTFSNFKMPSLGALKGDAPKPTGAQLADASTSMTDGVAAPAAELLPAPQPTTYTVKANDNLWKIAKAHHVDWDAMKAANPDYAAGKTMIAGKTIINLPAAEAAPVAHVAAAAHGATVASADTYIVKPNQTLTSIARDNQTSVRDLIRANPQLAANPNAIAAGQEIKLRPGTPVPSVKPDLTAATPAAAVPAAAAPVTARPQLRIVDNCAFNANTEGFQRVACGNADVTQINPGERLTFTVHGPNGSVETVTRTFNASAPTPVAKSEFINGVLPTVLNDLEKRGFMNASNLNVVASAGGSPAVAMP